MSVQRTKQGKENPQKEYEWINTPVWTESMLTALAKGLKGGNRRYPNSHFAELGLFSLEAAHIQACQSRCGNH